MPGLLVVAMWSVARRKWTPLTILMSWDGSKPSNGLFSVRGGGRARWRHRDGNVVRQ